MIEFLIRIAIEVPLAVVLFWMASMFWMAVHSSRLTKKYAQDQDFLDRFIGKLNTESSFTERTANLAPIHDNWALNVLLITRTELEAMSSMRTWSLVVCVAILIGSLFLGIAFVAINVGIFFFWAWAGNSTAAHSTAMGYLFSMARILYRWRRDDVGRFEEFLMSANGIHKLAASLDRYAT